METAFISMVLKSVLFWGRSHCMLYSVSLKNTVFQRKRNNRIPPWGPWNEEDESLCFCFCVVVCVLIVADMRKLDQMVVLNPLAKWHAHMKTKKARTLTVCARKKCKNRTINSLVSYYPIKYLYKVSPYVETWHMLQLVFRQV